MSWSDFYDSVKKTATRAADKINQTADLATLQVKLSLAEHKLNEAYAELGRVSYAHFESDDGEVDNVTAAMQVVKAAQAEVDAIRQQMETVKNTEKKPEE